MPVTDTTGRPAGEGADGLLGGGTHRVVLGGLGQLLGQSERGRQLLGPQPVVGEERVDEVERLLGVIRDVAAGQENLLYPIRDALRARVTVGEVSDALRDVWGTYQPKDAF